MAGSSRVNFFFFLAWLVGLFGCFVWGLEGGVCNFERRVSGKESSVLVEFGGVGGGEVKLRRMHASL